MTDQDAAEAQAPAATTIPEVRVVEAIPVVFVDSIASQSAAFGVSKMYFSRFDPDPHAQGGPTERIVMQVVMPVEAWIMSVAFLEHRLKMLLDQNLISRQAVDAARDYWVKNPQAGTAA